MLTRILFFGYDTKFINNFQFRILLFILKTCHNPAEEHLRCGKNAHLPSLNELAWNLNVNRAVKMLLAQLLKFAATLSTCKTYTRACVESD